MPSCSDYCTACDLPKDILRQPANKCNSLPVCYTEGSRYLENPDISGKSGYNYICRCAHARRPLVQTGGESESSNGTTTEIDKVGVNASCSIEVGGIYIVRSRDQVIRRRRRIVCCKDFADNLGGSGYLDDNRFRHLLIYLNKRMFTDQIHWWGPWLKRNRLWRLNQLGWAPCFP